MTKPYVKPMSFVGVAAVALTATGCSTYEEGPSSSLISKNNRLCREWQIDEYNGQSSSAYDTSLEFQKDGDFKLTSTYYGYTYTYSYSWMWKDDKSGVYITSNSDTLLSFDINRLTTDELWFTDMDNNDIKCIAID
ncbi:MAG: hypothetical protein C7N14_07110 [Bacteroidetes bacterium]|jgi:hypothetical protein|nr:MAG: hypothetical protein C7N14_07110 [Bacteroidota bacterium]